LKRHGGDWYQRSGGSCKTETGTTELLFRRPTRSRATVMESLSVSDAFCRCCCCCRATFAVPRRQSFHHRNDD
jgi:hypothetical protein